MPGSKRVTVIGGGVIGISSAHYLVKRGWQVTVIDKNAIGNACSHGNCGLVCPSHVLPLAEPGAVRQAIKSLFQPNAPFRVRPRIDLSLWWWLVQFARRCNSNDMIANGHPIQALLHSSMQLYEELVGQEGIECEWEKRGLFFVYQTKSAMDGYTATDRLLAETFHEPAVRYDGNSVRDIEPALVEGLAGGWLYEHDAHLRPDKLLTSWRKRLAELGVTFREQCEFLDFAATGQSVRKVIARNDEWEADQVVVATGAFTPMLSKALGCAVPIQPGKGYSMTMPRPSVCPSVPLIFPEHRVAVTPMQSGYRLGSIMEFAGYDATISPERIQLLTDGARHYLQTPTSAPIEEQWTGWRPMTWDSLPIIDWVPRYSNVLVAAGHNMLGLSMATATGKLVSELVDHAAPHLNPGPYSIRRLGIR